ncbi:MAG: hypothetical protein BMS9Abin37_1637 [Acidobacteriota bacterium]|nr:MAG: hypothetical protein BMS9Abin37_1637 [Acidobacteriota bacterium]
MILSRQARGARPSPTQLAFSGDRPYPQEASRARERDLRRSPRGVLPAFAGSPRLSGSWYRPPHHGDDARSTPIKKTPSSRCLRRMAPTRFRTRASDGFVTVRATAEGVTQEATAFTINVRTMVLFSCASMRTSPPQPHLPVTSTDSASARDRRRHPQAQLRRHQRAHRWPRRRKRPSHHRFRHHRLRATGVDQRRDVHRPSR